MTAAVASSRPPKPDYTPFAGLPDTPAIRELRGLPCWVTWDYTWKPDREKWDKPPLNPKNGLLGSTTDPQTWAPYETAAARASRDGLPGVGFVLHERAALSGIDLDACRDPETGRLQAWAQAVVDLRETYTEVSPSGRGLRLFVKGKVEGRKIDAAQVEIYAKDRYLTVTGRHVEGTPLDIREAPRTIAYLQERADQVREIQRSAREAGREHERKQAEKRAGAPQPEPRASISARAMPRPVEGSDFWAQVNAKALAGLSRWVPDLLPGARLNGGGVYRVTSRNLGRDLEEDLSISPQGIKDFGVHDMGDPNDGGRTPISLVMEHGGAAKPADAALWLCSRLGLDPAALGWRGARANAARGAQAASPSKTDKSIGGQMDETAQQTPRTSFFQGVPVPHERDRLQITQRLAEAPAFPVEHLPPIMREAVAALIEHVQAPPALCAHSIVSAAMLVTQALANVDIPPLGGPKPLSLLMLVVAVSGERKSACDSLALTAVAEHEAELRQEYETQAVAYKAARAAFEAEKKHIERDGKLSPEERRDRLMHLHEPEAPLLPVIRATEPNLEGLLNLLSNGRASVGIFTSEGGQFLGGHGMGEEARTRTITGISALWDDGSAQRVRAKEATFLSGRRVGISLAAQPKVASSLLTDELAKDQGFVGRFLVTMPDSTIGLRKIRASDPRGDRRLIEFHRQCRRLLGIPLPLRDGRRNEVQPVALTLSPEAWTVWQGLAQSIEDDCGADGKWLPVRSAALKLSENVARLAGILTVFESPATARKGGVISGETMAAAASIGLFYLTEALRLTGHSVLDPETRALNELAEWAAAKIGVGNLLSPSLIQRKAPSHLRTDAATTARRVRKLVEFGALEHVGRAEIEGKPVREAYRVIGEEGGK